MTRKEVRITLRLFTQGVSSQEKRESHHTTSSRNVVEGHHAVPQGSECLDRQGLGEQVGEVVVRVDMHHFNQARVTQATPHSNRASI